MIKKQVLKLIKEECDKIEEKYSTPLAIEWDDIFDDTDETQDIIVEVAYNSIKKILKQKRKE